MTLCTVSRNNMIATINRRRLTVSCSVIDGITVNAITAVSVVIETLRTVRNQTLLASLYSSKGLIVNISASMAFETAVFFNASFAMLN